MGSTKTGRAPPPGADQRLGLQAPVLLMRGRRPPPSACNLREAQGSAFVPGTLRVDPVSHFRVLRQVTLGLPPTVVSPSLP